MRTLGFIQMGEMTHTKERSRTTLHTPKGTERISDQGVFVQTYVTDFQLMSFHHSDF